MHTDHAEDQLIFPMDSVEERKRENAEQEDGKSMYYHVSWSNLYCFTIVNCVLFF